jgi:beta-galactosidase
MRIGVDYYPEHWPRELWKEYARLMSEAEIKVVRLAEFAWSRLEPSEGIYCFDWLDDAIETLANKKIEVVLGTPTAAPPVWMIEKYPDILPVDDKGLRLGFGSRLHRCLSHPRFRQASQAITQAMIDHYYNHPNVIGWQTDNEIGSGPPRCVCDLCQKGFQSWLKKKYSTIDQLNKQWGTVFWSQEYQTWQQIPAPRQPATGGALTHNPSLLLDYYRFHSDLIADFQHQQVQIIKAKAPHQFITHNTMGAFDIYDHFKFSEDLDFVSLDNYPTMAESPAFYLDLTRGLKEMKFWIMEQRSGPCGWATMTENTRPGQIRMWAWQAAARGADTVVFFRWRSCLSGTEQFWHGIIGHDNVPRRRYEEVKTLGKEFVKVSPELDGSIVKNDVAIINSYDEIWSLQIQPQTEGYNYWLQGKKFHHAFTRKGVGVDVVGLHTDFSQYKIIVFPSLYLLTPEVAEKISNYVRQGGAVLFSVRTGVKNWNNFAWDIPLPGLLRECAGIEIGDYDAVGAQTKNCIHTRTGQTYSVGTWCDIIDLNGAESLAEYTGEFYQNRPAFTVNRMGKGQAFYLGTIAEDSFYDQLVEQWIRELNLDAYPGLPGSVEASWRKKGDQRFLFLINLSNLQQQIPIREHFDDLLRGGALNGSHITLKPFGVEIFRAKT